MFDIDVISFSFRLFDIVLVVNKDATITSPLIIKPMENSKIENPSKDLILYLIFIYKIISSF